MEIGSAGSTTIIQTGHARIDITEDERGFTLVVVIPTIGSVIEPILSDESYVSLRVRGEA